ncbi:MAG: RelA/SpoT family protein [bacterium]|nr:RelA/SpoT family protein [bacterium]
MTITQVINNFKENNPKADTTMIKLAYDFAVKAHAGQKRKNGELYIQHCLHTAFVLTQIKADQEAVIAGLLHDIPEDTEHTLEEIEKNFGKETANLVEGITKLSKIKYRGIERYRESLRKMFLAMAQDLRVILIKFADRLHNLRTLDALPLEKRQRIARETLEIYAPIAGLLGIWRLKWQMEDICFKHLYPEEYKKLAYKYEVERKLEHNQYIQKTKNILSAKLKEAKIPFQITSRFKHLYSIYLKMQKKDRKFDEIYDVFALRIIVPDIADCYKVLGIIHSLWRPNPGRFKDYIAVPKPNGYRALHTTVYGPEGKSTEFQIRTKEMDEGAKYGIAAHWYYKIRGSYDKDLKKQPAWVKEVLNIQKETEDTSDFIKQIKFDVFHDRIFVFTPRGDVFDLPEGATPIDFAYYVHSDIGNQAVGALVNDKIAPLEQELKNGDLVEIITEKKRKGPSRDWLKFVKTATARNKIKQNLKSGMMDNLKRFIPKI